MPNEAMRKEGAHQFADCWCGHGDVNSSHGLQSLDGVHQMINVGHNETCLADCRSAHMHTHCSQCASEPGVKNCCKPAGVG
jgi:hypothetical protein